MGNDMLYKWEDFPALKHHCGVCKRPLSHPGAKSSCFGPHAEPCHRFHQAMFMRNRGHMCSICNGADEAHHKRHQDLAERLRNVYEMCGEDGSIIPTGEPETDRGRRRQSDSLEDTDSIAYPASSAKKREKKERKHLERASSRRRVITLEEVHYIESVLHPPGLNSDTGGPRNSEEVEEIERQLRYNAQLYNTGVKPRDVVEFARIPDAHVDFEGEMERILEILRVSELVKSNANNRGLQGKELKVFETSVDQFKERIVEDLLLLKKEEMETKMRRDGYLRYTNRSSFDTVKERYASRDWKTGEKFTESPAVRSMSSGSITAIEEDTDGNEDEETAVELCDPESPSPTPAGPDRRHLFHGHKRVSDNGRVEPVPISPVLRSKKSQGITKKRLRHLRIVSAHRSSTTGEPSPTKSSSVKSAKVRKVPQGRPSPRKSIHKKSSDDEDGWNLVVRNSRRTSVPNKGPHRALSTTSIWASNVWAQAEEQSVDCNNDLLITSKSSTLAESDEKTADEEVVQSNPFSQTSDIHTIESSPKSILPDVNVLPPSSPRPIKTGHPIVEQRKAKKKKQREAERKARRAVERERERATADKAAADDARAKQSEKITSKPLDTPLPSEATLETDRHTPKGPALPSEARTRMFRFGEATSAKEQPAIEFGGNFPVVSLSSIIHEPKSFEMPATIEMRYTQINPMARYTRLMEATKKVVTGGHHSDWKKFARHFKVDGLSLPHSIPVNTCVHNDTCIFETTSTKDCPFHKPHCDYCDHRNELSFVVYPSKDAFYLGPFFGPRIEKLLAKYEANPRTKGKLMIIDDDMLPWLLKEGVNPHQQADTGSEDMPHEMRHEIWDYYHTSHLMGPLMIQTERYRNLARINNSAETPIPKQDLFAIYEAFKADCDMNAKICICSIAPSADEAADTVDCAFGQCMHKTFHRACVQKLGVDKVSKWYCPNCEGVMGRVSKTVLKEVDFMRKGEPLFQPTASDILTGDIRCRNFCRG